MILLVLGLVIVLVAAAGYGYVAFDLRGHRGGGAAVATTEASPLPPATSAAAPTSASPRPSPSVKPTFAERGPGTFTYAGGSGPVMGSAGTLYRYKVAVEKGVPVKAADFAALVDTTLGDERSWIGGRNVRLQRVKSSESSTFTIYLATPGTTGSLCLAGGVDVRIDGKWYTSCRVGSKVVINLARFINGIPGYGASLDTYRQYAINHEVGHALGHGHELCPGKGKLAPVMQQQTIAMLGCKANQWPYLDGKRYAGRSGSV
ncbi:hypothetical protein GCM10009681_51860 [Luedemannella helvata]|uniref:DUF3152 domain-containing protein n=1 Tax=Luedemannella helvata TaxID=349315 RepID=A0ABP4X9G1_9ACTN